jgi:hypothetical protein
MTPENFLVPIGLNRDSALFLLADFEANVSSTAIRSSANKHQRVQQPLTNRTSFTNPGESNVFLQDIDGTYHQTRDKKDLGKREKELNPIWRLAKGREKQIMGKDCILQVGEYLQCAQLLTSILSADLTFLTGESLFLKERYYRTTVASQILIKSTKVTNMNVGNQSSAKESPCRFHMAFLLQTKLSDGKAISPCTKGKECYSSHQKLDEMTKSAAMLLAEKFNPTLRKSVVERIQLMTKKFKK